MKVILPRRVSRQIRTFGLPRPILLEFLNRIREVLEDLSGTAGMYRTKDERHCVFRFWFDEGPVEHLFILKVDDRRGPDLLVIVAIRHRSRRRRG